MRSEVQVLPGPPFPTRVSGAVAQLGERLLCKQDVVGSIPSGSTIPGVRYQVIRQQGLQRASCFLPVLFDIVKRRFVRVPPSGGSSPATLNRRHYDWLPNRASEQISRSWSFYANSIEPGSRTGSGSCLDPSIGRWALAMRMIKCLKGNWWMPWHAQAMKDVIRCDKLRGGANTL